MIMIHISVKVFSKGQFFAKFILFHVSLPIIGNLFSSLKQFILKNIMNGGFLIRLSYLIFILIYYALHSKKRICLSF